MRQVRVQFAPLERAQAARECRRRSVQFSGSPVSPEARAHALAAPARNVGITWKVILVLWLLFLAALCVRASLATQIPASDSPHPLTSATETQTGSRVSTTAASSIRSTDRDGSS